MQKFISEENILFVAETEEMIPILKSLSRISKKERRHKMASYTNVHPLFSQHPVLTVGKVYGLIFVPSSAGNYGWYIISSDSVIRELQLCY